MGGMWLVIGIGICLCLFGIVLCLVFAELRIGVL